MLRINLFACIIFLYLLFPLRSAFGCSAFFYTEQVLLFGRNLDWYSGEGYIIKNNRGIEKYSYSLGNAVPAHWVSKYGSVTFNQIGKEQPYGGINEAGLVAEQLWLHGTTYKDNHNHTVSELEWVQYQLDNYSTVEEVAAHIHTLTIKPVKATVHYFIADKTGNALVIDFIGGQAFLQFKKGNHQVLTNSTYESSCMYYENNKSSFSKSSRSSEDRFCQVSNAVSANQVQNANAAFSVLQSSAENKPNYKTYWSIVYDLQLMKVYYQTFGDSTTRSFDLKDFDFSSSSKTTGCNIQQNKFLQTEYTYPINRSLLEGSLKAMNIHLDIELAATHQMNPSKHVVDTLFQNNYFTLYTIFKLKNSGGNLFYTIASGSESFYTRRGGVSTMLFADSTYVYSASYALKKGEYALASFHDENGNKKLDGGLFGIPKEPFGFSRNKKRIFGLPPKYEKAVFYLQSDTTIIVRL